MHVCCTGNETVILQLHKLFPGFAYHSHLLTKLNGVSFLQKQKYESDKVHGMSQICSFCMCAHTHSWRPRQYLTFSNSWLGLWNFPLRPNSCGVLAFHLSRTSCSSTVELRWLECTVNDSLLCSAELYHHVPCLSL